MKHHIYILICFMFSFLQANAQARPDSVSVHAGQKPLVELLTDEQKETIKYLTVTGKLLDEDYKYIRESLIVKLKELNLRDADIDTIPEKALEAYYGYKEEEDITIILPERLKYLSDYSLCTDNYKRRIVVTGKYPDVGKLVFRPNSYKDYLYSNISISDDNRFLKEYECSIYSLDGSILYNSLVDDMIGCPDEDLKIIAPCAIECLSIYGLGIPETVDSIGDRAFANSRIIRPVGIPSWITTCCCALIPPRLGKDVFLNSDITEFRMFVPEESIELYKAAEGWKDLNLVGIPFPIEGIANMTDNCFQISDIDTTYKITASKNIKDIEIYDVKGLLTNEVKVNRKEVSISKATLAKPYAIVKLTFGDDTYRIIKLIP